MREGLLNEARLKIGGSDVLFGRIPWRCCAFGPDYFFWQLAFG
jgi:hypothetical protein